MSPDLPHITKSKFWNHLLHEVYGPRQGGAKIIVDAQDAKLGAGKTSACVALARLLARAFDYDFGKDDMTLSGAEYVERYREHPGKEQPSVLVLDEAVGAGAGDARRAMSNSNLDLASAWQTMRVERVVSIITLGHWSDLDKRLRRFADYRLNCRRRPFGHYRPYEVKVGFDDGKPRTKTLDKGIHFPDMAGDPLYEYISEQKAELLDAVTWDADELREQQQAAEADEEPDAPGPKEVAEEILSNGVEEYISTNQSNGTEYVDQDLIRMEYDLSHRDAKAAKALIEKKKFAKASSG